MSSPLCEQCASFFTGTYLFSGHTGKHDKWPKHIFRKLSTLRSRKACYICATLYQKLKLSFLPPSPSLSSSLPHSNRLIELVFSMHPVDYGIVRFNFKIGFADTPGVYPTEANYRIYRQSMLLLEQNESRLCREQEVPFGQVKSNSSASEEAWSKAKRRLNVYTSAHTRCEHKISGLDGVVEKESWYPTRLLDIRPTLNSDLRLVITKEERPSERWVTLSHCWGGVKDRFQLTTTSIESLRRGIRLKDIAVLFRDVVVAVRRLGFRYLWIDSFCILQDSLADWDTEASSMAMAYGRSSLTIAVTRSGSSDESIYAARNSAVLCPPVIVTTWDEFKNDSYILLSDSFWEDSLDSAPLTSRAWAVQERILSHRVLHFGSHQLLWECRELEACEMFPSGIPSLIRRELEFKRVKELFEQRRNPVEVWANVLEKYSVCHMTKETDKLVALSGVAKSIKGFLGEDYLAGLWLAHLPNLLLWATDDPSASRTKVYRAPTWSWASVVSRR